ncbi:hypothetical protein C8D91_0628 [Marinicella litoralis]|uniref:Uncharacterized protein n=1 Tax=Marinicella litoralis TaxID=644220 RepID=A0A4R6XUS8_9GAMM|nr:hypothetical protein C8D91_0628 [Marinicella litoralis]
MIDVKVPWNNQAQQHPKKVQAAAQDPEFKWLFWWVFMGHKRSDRVQIKSALILT